MNIEDLDQVRTIAQAAEELGVGKETLRTQWRRGRFAAREVGSVLLTTVDEVERYRRESLGRPGRPLSVAIDNLLDAKVRDPLKAPTDRLIEKAIGKPRSTRG